MNAICRVELLRQKSFYEQLRQSKVVNPETMYEQAYRLPGKPPGQTSSKLGDPSDTNWVPQRSFVLPSDSEGNDDFSGSLQTAAQLQISPRLPQIPSKITRFAVIKTIAKDRNNPPETTSSIPSHRIRRKLFQPTSRYSNEKFSGPDALQAQLSQYNGESQYRQQRLPPIGVRGMKLNGDDFSSEFAINNRPNPEKMASTLGVTHERREFYQNCWYHIPQAIGSGQRQVLVRSIPTGSSTIENFPNVLRVAVSSGGGGGDVVPAASFPPVGQCVRLRGKKWYNDGGVSEGAMLKRQIIQQRRQWQKRPNPSQSMMGAILSFRPDD